jgi:transposase InsO family protein
VRIFNKNKGVKGSRTLFERSIRFRYMITVEAQHRVKILTFWKKHGLEATEEAYGVKERTLYLWQKKLRERGGKLEALNNGSRAPKNRRKRRYDYRIVGEIRRLREYHPNIGEKKLYPLLQTYCDSVSLMCPKPATICNIMRDKGGMRTFPERITGTGKIRKVNRQKVLRKPKNIRARRPGELVALDTIEVIIHGSRRYLITCEDICSRFAFAFATTSHASRAAQAFFDGWRQVFPLTTTFVLTDNGSEFKKHFAQHLLNLQITHYHTYPKTPKMNAHVERFNRTIQEEFADFHRGLLLEPDRFNEKLVDWLVFYNTKRVHHAFGNKMTPLGFLLQWGGLSEDCKSRLGYTRACKRQVCVVKSSTECTTVGYE